MTPEHSCLTNMKNFVSGKHSALYKDDTLTISSNGYTKTMPKLEQIRSGTANLEKRLGTSSSQGPQQLSWLSIVLGCFLWQVHWHSVTSGHCQTSSDSLFYLCFDFSDSEERRPKHSWAISSTLHLPSRRVPIPKLNTFQMCLRAARNVQLLLCFKSLCLSLCN